MAGTTFSSSQPPHIDFTIVRNVCQEVLSYDKLKSIFSQGVITLMAAVLGTNFFEKCYTPLGEVMDLVALANCTVMSNYM